ncbi:MAG: MBL fold metallo-hydrolase [Actinomycetota bacterium]|nr:MBL fold metallo-hydrolase [Actinomycetota bacterium]
MHSRFPWGEEIADGLLVFKGTASANTIDTGNGLVMLDTGGQPDTEDLYRAVRKWRARTPLVSAVFSHHHVDHVFGTGPFEREATERGLSRPVVYGHAGLRGNFDRYLRTPGWNVAINMRQFGRGGIEFAMPDHFRYPDVTYEQKLTFSVGSLSFELHHARGETDDATWTWVPERRFLHPGDLFIWAVPNAGNPQKVQRFVGEWAVALREMAGLGAEVLLPGHGLPVIGADRVREALSDTAEYLESIEAQVLAQMELGLALDEILHNVTVPARLQDKPYLQAVYDHPEFLVRNVWRQFGGWYDGQPDHLLPAPRAEEAAEWIRLAGGTAAVLSRAEQLLEGGNARLACHLIEHAVVADPKSDAVHELRARVYRARAEGESASMARNIFAHSARSSEAGVRDLAVKKEGGGT